MTEYSLFDAKTLNDFKKKELVELVMELQKEKKVLASQVSIIAGITDRVTELEKSHYLYLQYGRRSTIEITGIPANVDQKDLEGHVINIFKEANVKVHGNSLDHMDIEACHRIGKKNKVIARFTNRKFARESLYKSKNLKGTKLYGDQAIYINESLCKQFHYIGFVIRKLKRCEMIESYKIRNGVFSIKIGENDRFEEISHVNDFRKNNLDIETALAE